MKMKWVFLLVFFFLEAFAASAIWLSGVPLERGPDLAVFYICSVIGGFWLAGMMAALIKDIQDDE